MHRALNASVVSTRLLFSWMLLPCRCFCKASDHYVLQFVSVCARPMCAGATGAASSHLSPGRLHARCSLQLCSVPLLNLLGELCAPVAIAMHCATLCFGRDGCGCVLLGALLPRVQLLAPVPLHSFGGGCFVVSGARVCLRGARGRVA